jgi:hypothetical protein
MLTKARHDCVKRGGQRQVAESDVTHGAVYAGVNDLSFLRF